MWNPVKLVDPNGMEAEDDWYKDTEGYVHWSSEVHSQDDLRKGETYIGRSVLMTEEGSDEVLYGDQYGHTHHSVSLKDAYITRDRPNYLVRRMHESAGEFWGNPVTKGVIIGMGTLIGLSELSMLINSGSILSTGGEVVATGGSSTMISSNSIEKLVLDAQRLYPKKAGKIEMHHIVPKYLGGDPKGPMVAIDAAYHQVITNAFRSIYKYGQAPPSAEVLERILKMVYGKFPIPTP